MKTVLLGTVALSMFCTLASCDPRPPPPVSVDAPQLAASLKWVGSCAVICSALGAAALVIASHNRRK